MVHAWKLWYPLYHAQCQDLYFYFTDWFKLTRTSKMTSEKKYLTFHIVKYHFTRHAALHECILYIVDLYEQASFVKLSCTCTLNTDIV